MNEGTLLLSVQRSHDSLEFTKLFLLFLKCLILCLADEVELVDEFFELRGAGVHVFEKLGVQVLLIVKLSDFSFRVHVDTSIIEPILTGELLEDVELDLAHSRRGSFRSLGEVEGQSEELFLVRRIQVELFDGLLVVRKAISDSIFDVLVRAQSWHVLWGHLVDELLQLVWVALDFLKLLSIAVGNVFETMDLTKLPEDRVGILALTLNLEDLGQISLLTDAFDHMLQKLRLRKRVLVIHSQVVKKLILAGAALLILEESKAADGVVLSLVALSSDTLVSAGKFLEEANRHLKATEVGEAKDTGDHWVAHPLLAEDGTACLHFSLNGHPFVGCETTAGQAPHLLNLLDAHNFVNLFSVLVVVAIASHDAANGVLAHSVRRVRHIAKVPVLLQLLLHLIYICYNN